MLRFGQKWRPKALKRRPGAARGLFWGGLGAQEATGLENVDFLHAFGHRIWEPFWHLGLIFHSSGGVSELVGAESCAEPVFSSVFDVFLMFFKRFLGAVAQ